LVAIPLACILVRIPIHPYTHAPMLPCTGTPIHPYTHTPIHPYTHAPMHHPCTDTPMHPYTHAPIHPCTHTPMHPCTQHLYTSILLLQLLNKLREHNIYVMSYEHLEEV